MSFKKKRGIISIVLTMCMTITGLPGGYLSYASPLKQELNSVGIVKPVFKSRSNSATASDASASNAFQKAVSDWEIDQPQGNEIIQMDGEWIHFKSGSGNDNNTKPAVMLNNKVGEIKNGTAEFTVKANDIPDNTRFGIFLRYKEPKNSIFVGYDKQGWFWQIFNGNSNPYFTGKRKAAPEKGEEASVRVTYSGNQMDVYLNGEMIFQDVDISTVPGPGAVGFRAGGWGSIQTDVMLKDIKLEKEKTIRISGTVTAEDGTGIDGATVSAGASSTSTNADGTFILEEVGKGTHELTVLKSGYVTVLQSVTAAEEDISGIHITLHEKDMEDVRIISSDVMSVEVDTTFPRVIRYIYDGKEFAGQEDQLTKVKINGIDVVPVVTSDFEKGRAVYRMTFLNTESGIDAVITAELKVEGNTLEFNITDIEDHKIVKTIEIPDHGLLSVKSIDPDAQFAGANMSTNTHKSGDTVLAVDDSYQVSANAKKGYMYAFLSNGKLSAGLWSNSENKISADWQRVTATSRQKTGFKEVLLSSTYWTFQKDADYRKENGILDYGDGVTMEIPELPSAKVAIAPDLNSDGTLDWQDGAIAYRDIMNNPVGSEKVPELVAYRISMNFGSQAQNPFLSVLDGVKKVYLHTEGLGQSILLKGYGSEGHDSGHLNYADIGRRMGGAEDLRFLMEKGKNYGATFGVHVNASETYPESKYFDEDRLLRNNSGGYSYGWNWLDQGININADYDLKNGRGSRFKDFYDILGGENNDLDFIYVDVWGNGQSGDNGSWPSRQLAKEINGLGWRLAGEWGHANEFDSTFQHWAADLTYGGYNSKGINSAITRFLRNHQKDSWVGNYPSYGGAAEAPLLGGYSMKDFEGWQGRSDYAAYIKNLYEVDVPSKFVQHYQVTNWENGKAVKMTDNGETYNWTPEMRVVLQDKEQKNTLEITRNSNDYTGNVNAFRSRTMAFNGKEILKGREGNSSYLIPWFWDQNGVELSEDDYKLYHWNTKGGETNWEVPDGWSGSAYIYELTDLGKTGEQEIPIVDGMITLDVEPATPYVLYKYSESDKEVQWSEGMHLIDSGFNSSTLDHWQITGDSDSAQVVRSQGSNFMLKIAGNKEEVTLTQTLTDLEPNTRYAAYVGIDNRSTKEAVMEIHTGDSSYANSAPTSIALNYVSAYAHNNKPHNATVNNQSYFQNMYVYFETGKDVSDVTLTLKRSGDKAATYFDDIRIVKNPSVNQISETAFVQDFEHVPQGIWPFVVGGVEGVVDNRTHLSERHDPYTQIGWNGKAVDDVISGDWSLKTNGLTQREGLLYQTIPQNFKFKPGVDYIVSFDYEAGSDNTYALVANDQPYNENGAEILHQFANTVDAGKAQTYEFLLTGSDNGQTWFGIYSTDVAADTRGETMNGQINFNGYNDFILDNLKITVSSSQKESLREVLTEALAKEKDNYSEDTWNSFHEVLEASKKVNDDLTAEQTAVDQAALALRQAIDGLVKTGGSVAGKITDKNQKPLSGIRVVLISADGKQFIDTTDDTGSYRIAGGYYGINTIAVDDIGFDRILKTIDIKPDTDVSMLNLTLNPAYTSINGTVTIAGKAAQGVSVKISADGVNEQEVLTDADGAYHFTDVVVKNYNMFVYKEGYDKLSLSVPTDKHHGTVKNIMLQPVTGADYVNDFENGAASLKNLSGNAVISAESGKARINFKGTGNVYDEKSPQFLNGSVEADLTAVTDSPRVGLILRASDENNRVYAGTLDASDTWFAEHWGTGGNAWSSGFTADGTNGKLALTAGTTVHMKAEIIDKNLKLWVDNVLIFDLTMNGMHMKPGYAGFYSRSAKDIIVDNLSVTVYDQPEAGTQTIVGRVADAGGMPVEGVQISMSSNTGAMADQTVKTNANGEYVIGNMPLGQYQITVIKAGAADVVLPVELEKVPFYYMIEEVTLGIQPTVVKTGLINVIARAKDLVQEQYTDKSWKIFAEALQSAEACAGNAAVNQSQVDQASQTLKNAIDSLAASADKTILVIAVEALEAVITEGNYTPDSWKAYADALNAAKKVMSDLDAVQDQVARALKDLSLAVRGLTVITQ